jgi:hypothetical protein
MLISARESSRILEAGGVCRQQSRRVLLAGLAGPAAPSGHALLYDEARVLALAARPPVDHAELLASCPTGVLVIRLPPGAEPAGDTSWERRADAVRIQPHLGFPAWAHLRARLVRRGRLACVATVCGYPVLTADLVSVRSTADDRLELGLESAGEWEACVERRRLVTGSGPAWLLLGEPPYLGRARSAHDRGEPVGAARSTTWSRWA